MFIFSSLQRHYEGGRSWWGQGLPKTIRSFDADVCSIPGNDILSSLEMLPQLELLHLETLTAPGCLIPCAPMCWTALLILSIYSCIFDFIISISPPVSPAIQFPGLTSLATDLISVHARLSSPLDALRGLEYFQVLRPSSSLGHYSDYFATWKSSPTRLAFGVG